MIPVPPREVAHAGLRALVQIARADGELRKIERDLLDSAQALILETDFDLDALAPISPEELAAAIPPEFGERVVHAGILLTLIDGESHPGELGLVDDYAAALGVDDASLADLHRYASGCFTILRFDILRRFIAADRFKLEYEDHGVRGLLQLAKTAILGKDEALAARYRALGELPEGTLGHEYLRFMESNGFALPGEPGAAPEPIVFHDCNHVLGEYGTTPLEETQVLAFHAGNRKRDPFGLLLFGLMQFHLGVQISPVTDGVKGSIKPKLLLEAFQRGTELNTDLVETWRPQSDWEVPLSELRERFGVPPRRFPSEADLA